MGIAENDATPIANGDVKERICPLANLFSEILQWIIRRRELAHSQRSCESRHANHLSAGSGNRSLFGEP